MRIYKISAYTSVFIWLVTGILIIGSIALGYNGMYAYIMYINIIMGIIFWLISFYLYYKTKNTLSIVNEINYFKLHSNANSFESLNKFIITEMIFNILSLFISIMLLSAVISRIWGEGQPVFG